MSEDHVHSRKSSLTQDPANPDRFPGVTASSEKKGPQRPEKIKAKNVRDLEKRIARRKKQNKHLPFDEWPKTEIKLYKKDLADLNLHLPKSKKIKVDHKKQKDDLKKEKMHPAQSEEDAYLKAKAKLDLTTEEGKAKQKALKDALMKGGI